MSTQPIPVLPYQVTAAKLLLLLAEKDGRPVSPKVRMLARAEQTPREDSPYVVNGVHSDTADAAATPLPSEPADTP